jgi:hypothetical protein
MPEIIMTQSKFVLERLGLKIPKLRNFPALPEDTGAERHKKTSPAGTVDFVESLSEYLLRFCLALILNFLFQ